MSLHLNAISKCVSSTYVYHSDTGANKKYWDSEKNKGLILEYVATLPAFTIIIIIFFKRRNNKLLLNVSATYC